MKKIIHNIFTLLISILGVIIGLIWGYKSNWEFEPILITFVSICEIVLFLTLPKTTTDEHPATKLNQVNKNHNENNQNVEININNTIESTSNSIPQSPIPKDRNAIIETKKEKVGILFIDDDTKFNVVKILKDSGWKKTKSVVDIKSIDLPVVRNSDIIFVDINGVGKIIELENEGLDLALMLKQKYSEKKIIIYSAKKNSNSFHKAWDIIDSRLEKNALPYQFQNLVENYSLEFYN